MQHVVIVDDSPEVSRLLKSALLTLDQNLKVTNITSGEDVMPVFERQQVNLLIVDLRPPGMTGVELVRKVQERSPKTYVILMTGLPDHKLPASLNQIHYDALFRKPMPLAEFLEAVRGLLKITAPLRKGLEKPKTDPYGGLLNGRVKELNSQQLTDLLVGLRRRIEASAVMLVEGNGQVCSLDGELPSLDFLTKWIPIVLSARRKNTDILRELKIQEVFPSVEILYCESFNLITSPVGKFALFIVLPKTSSALRMALAIEEISLLRIDLSKSSKSKDSGRLSSASDTAKSKDSGKLSPEVTRSKDSGGLSPDAAKSKDSGRLPSASDTANERASPSSQPKPEEKAAEADKELPDKEILSKILTQSIEKLDAAETDAFWDQMVGESEVVDVNDPSFMSYGKAQELGLIPPADAE